MAARKLTPAIRAEVLAAYCAGEKVEVIGVRFGVHFSLPISFARRAGIPRNRKRGAWGKRRVAEHT